MKTDQKKNLHDKRAEKPIEAKIPAAEKKEIASFFNAGNAGQSAASGIKPSAGSLQKSGSADSAKKPSAGLSSTQKYALIGGSIILAIVLGAMLLFPQSSGDDSSAFSNVLYTNPKSGIIMDMREAPSTIANQKILQCGVNLIQGGFYKKTQKDLLTYFCDSKGCVSSHYLYNETNVSVETTNTTISFADALTGMAGRTYFHIKYAPEGSKVFFPNYAVVSLNEESDTNCEINVNVE